MSEQESNSDSLVDAFSAVAIISIAVVVCIYWISNQ
ncbi:MAG: hypothetical protein ACJAVI_001698 [Candidatus Azotimanducaceae bacterium]|jgi:hypothetical protein